MAKTNYTVARVQTRTKDSIGKRAKPPNNAEWRYSLSLYRHTT